MSTSVREFDSFKFASVVKLPLGRGSITIHALERDRVRYEGSFNLRGVDYSLSGFAWRDENGWTDREDRAFGVSLSRTDRYGDGSASAVAAARKAVLPVVNRWASEHGDELERAERAWRSNEARNAEGRLAQADDYCRRLREFIAGTDAGIIRESSYSVQLDGVNHEARR